MFFFFFKQKTAYEMRISDWSSDVCSSDLIRVRAVTDQQESDGQCDDRNQNIRHLLAPLFCRLRTTKRFSITRCRLSFGDFPRDAMRQKPCARYRAGLPLFRKIGRASCRERVCQYV